jgi:peptidoglycan/xylan/chitin deacetylase (PgdA/CDA1 family)
MPWKDGYTISDERSIADADLHWPGGNRCCVGVVVDLSVAVGPEGIRAQDLKSDPAQFGMHDGLDQLVAVLKRHTVKATFAVPAVMAKIQRERLRTVLADGHEVAAHGFRHEDVSTLDRAEEKARLALTTEVLTDAIGKRPVGWFSLPRRDDPFAGGTVSANTMDLLIEGGYSYMGNGLADDIPHYWVADFATRRAILTLPYYYHFDDLFFDMFPAKGTGLENPDFLFRNWKAEFDAQYKRGRYFHMVLHPRASGWGHRVQLLDDFLAHMRNFPGLWVPTGAEVAQYWQEAYPARTQLKLEPSIWQDYPGSLS